jgi:hypothetical protein
MQGSVHINKTVSQITYGANSAKSLAQHKVAGSTAANHQAPELVQGQHEYSDDVCDIVWLWSTSVRLCRPDSMHSRRLM